MSDPLGTLDSPHARRRALLTHDRLLGRRVYVYAIVRFVVAGAIAGGALFGRYVAGVAGLDVFGIFAVAAYMAAYNVPIMLTAGQSLDSEPTPERLVTLRVVKHTATLLDYLALTAVIWFLGGVRSPFVAFYLFHIVIASTLLPLRAAVVSAFTAGAMLVALAVCEATGVLPPRMPEGVVLSTAPLEPSAIVTILLVYFVLFALVTTLVSNIAAMLRHGEETLVDQAEELERLNDQRRELLQLTLHNLQSPVAAAAMLMANLRNGLCGEIGDQQAEQVDKALRRLDSITGFIRDLGMLARLESDDLAGQTEPIDIRGMLDEIAAEHRERAAELKLHFTVSTPTHAVALGVPRLVREAIVNYVTNSIKYTPAGGSISVKANDEDGRIRVEVADTGIGIAPDKQDRIFGEYVRLAPKDPRLGKTEGTGLGLSIVKKCIERQHGRVGFASEPDHGSTFWLELPKPGAG
ncbi:MAG: HAMP domain-containing histidine kinase [Phycisphaeraceae bacterium]|nr:MAG: HAMP domain-containing histidine kinase [Phycisphaeraceae bacterium]